MLEFLKSLFLQSKTDKNIGKLLQADAELDGAYVTHNLRPLLNYFTGDALKYIKRVVMNSAYSVGRSRTRHVTFEKADDSDLCYIRSVEFDPIRLMRGINVPTGQSTKDLWTLDQLPNFLVTDIEEYEHERPDDSSIHFQV